MSFKINWWAVGGGGVVLVAGLILMVTAAVPAEEQIRQAVVGEVRSKLTAEGAKEGVDFTIGAVEIVSREDGRALTQTSVTPAPLPWFHDVIKRSGEWIVSKKLDEDFAEFIHDPANVRLILKRVYERLRERHPTLGNVKPPKEGNYPIRTSLQRLPTGIAGTCEVSFWYSLVKDEKRHCRFLQDFAYQNGTWVFGSHGQFFDVPKHEPKPPKEK